MKKKIKLDDWKKMSLFELMKKYEINISEVYKIAIEQELYKNETPIERRAWKKEEKSLLLEYKDYLTIREFSNIFHKSYYAMLGQVKVMGLYEMIQKKNYRKGKNK